MNRSRRAVAVGLATLVTLAPAASGEPSWRTPLQLSGADIAVDPDLALDRSGAAVVVWDHEVGDACADQPANPACVHIVEARSRQSRGAAWAPAAEIARPGIGSAPQVALDASGDAVVIWAHDIGADRVVQASYRRGTTGEWQAPIDLSEVVPSVGPHDVRLDAAGNAVTVWEAAGSVWAEARPASSGVWDAPRLLSSGRVSAGPVIEMDRQGNVTAAWVESGVVVARTREAAGGAWSAAAVLSSTEAGQPAIAVNASGDALVTWARRAGEPYSVESSARLAGGAWSAPLVLENLLPSAGEPDVALDSGGDAVAVWVGGSKGRGMQSATLVRGASGWSNRVDVRAPDQSAFEPHVAVDGKGNAVAVWIHETGNAVDTALRPLEAGAWLAPTALAGATAPVEDLAVAADEGVALAVWARLDGRNSRVEAAELDGVGPTIVSLTVPERATAGRPVSFAVRTAAWTAPLSGFPAWRFGDGVSGTGTSPTHVYSAPGQYEVAVSQADVTGATATVHATIEIVAAEVENTTRPSVRGRARLGATLTCTFGSWTGTQPITFTFSWLRNGGALAAAKQRYRVRRRDVGARIACRVTAANAAGTASATSRPVRIRR